MTAAAVLAVQVRAEGVAETAKKVQGLASDMEKAGKTAGVASDDIGSAGERGGAGFEGTARKVQVLSGEIEKAGKASGTAAGQMSEAGKRAGGGFAEGSKSVLVLSGDIEKAGNAAGVAADDMGDAGARGGSGFSEKAKAGLGKLKGILAGVGAAAGAALAAGVLKAIDVEQAADKLSAQLGVSGARAKQLGKVAGDLYANAYGDSLESVNTALKGVIQNGLVMEDASKKQIKGVTAKVLDLATAFDQDLGGVTKAVGQMMKTGLAKNADEALDVLTRGFQQGADKADDLLDTMNEYGTQFRKFGLDGATATGLLSQGLKGGARDADLVADSIKEFSIRSQEAIEAVDSKGRPHLTELGQAFANLGLDGYKMQEQIAKGGPGASKALDVVLDRLRGVKDPVNQATAATALFGTQAEDMGAALFALDPSSAVAALGKVGGAAETMGDTLNDNASARIETFKRKAMGGLVSFIGNVAIPGLLALEPAARAVGAAFGGLVGGVADVAGWFREHAKTSAVLGSALGTLVTVWAGYKTVAIASAVATNLSTAAASRGTAAWVVKQAALVAVSAATSAYTGVQWLLNAAMSANPLGLVIAALAALAIGVVLAYQKSETFRQIVTGAWDAIKAATSVAWEVIKAVFGAIIDYYQTVGGVYLTVGKAIVGAVRDAWNAVKDAITGPASAAFSWVKAAVNDVKGFLDARWNDIRGAANAAWDAVRNNIVEPITGAASGVRNALGQGGLAGWLGSVWNNIRGAANEAWDVVRKHIVDPIAGAASSVRNALGQDGLTGWLASVWNTIRGAANTAWDVVKGHIVDPITGAASGVRNALGAEGLAGWLVAVWGAIRGAATVAWDAVKGNIVEPIKDAASGVRNALGMDGLLGWLAGIIGNAKDLGGRIGGAIKGGIGGALDGVVAMVRGVLNPVIDAANKVIRGVNKLPKVNIPEIPGLAVGARNFAGGLAMVGERGPELVNLPRGADVYTAQDTRSMMSKPAAFDASSPSGPMVIIEHMEVHDRFDEQAFAADLAWRLTA